MEQLQDAVAFDNGMMELESQQQAGKSDVRGIGHGMKLELVVFKNASCELEAWRNLNR